MNKQAPPDSNAPEPDDLPSIPLPDLNAVSNDDEPGGSSEPPRDLYPTGGAFWAEALRDAARPTTESAKLEELIAALGKDPGVQDKLSEDDDLEFGD